MPKTDEQIVEAANDLARKISYLLGYRVAQGHRFDKRRDHPRDRRAWDIAAQAYDHIQRTDINNAADSLE